VLRPLSLLPALVVATATLVAPGSAHAGPPAGDDSPLAVTIDALAPAYIPKRGPIRVTGSVTNNDAAPWTTVNVYAFIGRGPMTTSAELAEAATFEPGRDVGDRITAPNAYDTIERIDPGQSAQFSVRVPRSAITASEPGVYWFGLHALGTGPEGRVEGADGRARTFLPLVPRTNREVDTALVVPLRRRVTFARDGRLTGVPAWTRDLSPGGQLRSIVDFGASAGSRPITWLVDPAVPDAVRALAAGNPPLSLGPDEQEAEEEGGADDGDSPGPTASPEATPDSSEAPDPEAPTVPEATIEAANAWLERLPVALEASQVLTLPYGDVDVPAAAKRGPSIHERARARSDNPAVPLGSPGVSPPSGYLDEAGLRLLKRDTTVLLKEGAFLEGAPPVARILGRRIVPTSPAAAAGGPGPDDPLAPVAVRQRILSEAALRLISPGRQPLVVELPSDWVPTATTGFFEGLDQDWVDLTTVAGVATAHRARRVPVTGLAYPARQARRELRAGLFGAVDSLILAGDTLEAVLTRNDTVAQAVVDQGLVSLSYASRGRQGEARGSVQRSRRWIRKQLASVRIVAPPRVTLSSASGRFAATLVNELDQPVTVGINAVSDEQMTISGPPAVDIPAGGRTTVLLNARTGQLGIHNVTLVLTDTEGTSLGSSDTVPIRAAQVSAVIWLILGTGVALLFGAIAVRLIRRVRAATRAARATPAPRHP
jgi:hypothetical protein